MRSCAIRRHWLGWMQIKSPSDLARALLPDIKDRQFMDIGEFSRPVHVRSRAPIGASRALQYHHLNSRGRAADRVNRWKIAQLGGGMFSASYPSIVFWAFSSRALLAIISERAEAKKVFRRLQIVLD